MKNYYNEELNISVDGHVQFKDMTTNEILLDKHNAINFQNFAFAVASALANKTENDNQFFIDKIAFGFGATIIDASGNVTYKNPKIDGVNGSLYNAFLDVNNNAITKQTTSITVTDAESNPYTDITVQVILDTELAAFKDASDNVVINEIALVTETGHHLTHLVFHPILKNINKKIEILYSIRIRAGV